MDLTGYLKQRGGSGQPECLATQQLAVSAGCAPTTLYMIALGHKRASWKLAARIEAATNGAVTRHDLRPDVFGEAQTDS